MLAELQADVISFVTTLISFSTSSAMLLPSSAHLACAAWVFIFEIMLAKPRYVLERSE